MSGDTTRRSSAALGRLLNRAALRFPEAAHSYRAVRRHLRSLPRRARRLAQPASLRLRRAPVPDPLLRAVWWLRTAERGVLVPLDRLLLGGENGLRGADYAELTAQPQRPSTRIQDSPYVSLLREADRRGDGLGPWFFDSEYYHNARRCVAACGHYFGAHDDASIRDGALAFVQAGPPADGSIGRTPPAQPVRVRPIRRSSYFEIVDGHHRAARAWHRGDRELVVDIERGTSSTLLQELLNSMSWIDGAAELYQPVAAPEVSSWSLVRSCTGRLDQMLKLLADEALHPGDGRRYLDVGSCYGWFVAQMAEHGWDARGIELDPAAPALGRLVYGLEPSRIDVGDCAELLADRGRAEVVSCFSVAHHFALGRGSCSVEELLRRLDAVTGEVLFFETGQVHEAWFAESLAGWDEDFIERWILDTSTFRRVIRLGTDDDAVGRYERNYGRTLFACLR